MKCDLCYNHAFQAIVRWDDRYAQDKYKFSELFKAHVPCTIQIWSVTGSYQSISIYFFCLYSNNTTISIVTSPSGHTLGLSYTFGGVPRPKISKRCTLACQVQTPNKLKLVEVATTLYQECCLKWVVKFFMTSKCEHLNYLSKATSQ